MSWEIYSYKHNKCCCICFWRAVRTNAYVHHEYLFSKELIIILRIMFFVICATIISKFGDPISSQTIINRTNFRKLFTESRGNSKWAMNVGVNVNTSRIHHFTMQPSLICRHSLQTRLFSGSIIHISPPGNYSISRDVKVSWCNQCWCFACL